MVEFDLTIAMDRVGMKRVGRRAGPCPACGSSGTKTDSRPPVLVGAHGWRCVACSERGDAVSLVAAALEIPRPVRGAGFRKIIHWLSENGQGLQPRTAQERVEDAPARVDPSEALRRAVPLHTARSPDLQSWMARRRISPAAPGFWLPSFEAPWWPAGWSAKWPLVVPACSGGGEVLSMQGIAVRSDIKPTKIWPKGASSGGLLFADEKIRAWLRGVEQAPTTLVVVEGAPDYLTMAPVAPTIGVYSGAATALSVVRIPKGVKVVVGTHADDAGDRYAAAIADALNGHPVRRIRLSRLDKVL